MTVCSEARARAEPPFAVCNLTRSRNERVSALLASSLDVRAVSSSAALWSALDAQNLQVVAHGWGGYAYDLRNLNQGKTLGIKVARALTSIYHVLRVCRLRHCGESTVR